MQENAMKESYHLNARENTLRMRYETAKKTLEGLAEDESIVFSAANAELPMLHRLEEALGVMGFQRETISGKRVGEDEEGIIPVYTRIHKGEKEILADHALDWDNQETLGGDNRDHKDNVKMSLYRISAARDIATWYGEISNVAQQRHHKARLAVSLALLPTIALSTLIVLDHPTTHFLDNYLPEAAQFFLAASAPVMAMAGSIVFVDKGISHGRYHPLHKELAHNGSKALKYIAKTPFEDALR